MKVLRCTSLRLGAAVAAVLTAAAVQAQPAQLSAEALDEVVAGNQQPASTETDSVHPDLIVADAHLDWQTRRRVELQDVTQSQLAVLNAVNSAQADVANALNVLQSSGMVGSQQFNSIEQSERGVASVASIERFGANRSVTSEHHGGYDLASTDYWHSEHLLRSRLHTETLDTFNAEVPTYNPFQNLTFTIGTPKLPSVTVPRFGFDLTTEDDVGGVYGIRGGLGPFKFDPPQIVLGTVSLSGNDIVLRGGYIDLPSLDLGSASIDLCFIDCAGVSVDLPTINGPRVDFGSAGELRLPGANPFKDVRVNAGGGASVAGSGHIGVSAGHVRVAAEVSLDLPDLSTGFSFDVLGYTVTTPDFGITIPPISASIELINADVGVAYSVDFDGVLCVSIATTRCDGLEHHETREDSHVDVTNTTASASRTSSNSASSTGTETVTVGGRMIGAEGDLIAMSEGTANVDTESVVQLDSQAQRGMKAFNAVNATGAMVGNGINVGAQRPVVATTPSAFSQSNTFSQFQTRPRGPGR